MNPWFEEFIGLPDISNSDRRMCLGVVISYSLGIIFNKTHDVVRFLSPFSTAMDHTTFIVVMNNYGGIITHAARGYNT